MTASAPAPTTVPRSHALLGLAAFVVFAALVSVALGSREFWTDETITSGHIVTLKSTIHPTHPPAYFVLAWAWTQAFGSGDVALRSFSVVWSLLTFVLVTALGRRVLEPRAVVLGQWLFALSPFVVLYFRMARWYSMLTAAWLLVMYCAVLVVQEGRRRHWAGLAGATLLLMVTNYTISMLLGPLYVLLAWRALRTRQLKRFAAAAVPALALAVFMAPQVLHQGAKYDAALNTGEGGGVAGLRGVVLKAGLSAYGMAIGETTFPWVWWVVIPGALATLVAAIAGLRTYGRRLDSGLVVWGWVYVVAMVVAVSSTIARGGEITLVSRYSLVGVPLAYLALAGGLASLWRRGTSKQDACPTRVAAAAALACLLLVDAHGLTNYFLKRQSLNPAYVTPWREVARTIESRQQPGDRVVVFSDKTLARYGSFPDLIDWRAEDIPRFGDPLADWPQSGGRVWLVHRDRGSESARRSEMAVAEALKARAGRTDVFTFLPCPPEERAFRSRYLRRSHEEFYVTVYLFRP